MIIPVRGYYNAWELLICMLSKASRLSITLIYSKSTHTQKEQREVFILVFAPLLPSHPHLVSPFLLFILTFSLLFTSSSSFFPLTLSFFLVLARKQSYPLFIEADLKGGSARSCWILFKFVWGARVCVQFLSAGWSQCDCNTLIQLQKKTDTFITMSSPKSEESVWSELWPFDAVLKYSQNKSWG